VLFVVAIAPPGSVVFSEMLNVDPLLSTSIVLLKTNLPSTLMEYTYVPFGGLRGSAAVTGSAVHHASIVITRKNDLPNVGCKEVIVNSDLVFARR
jgi:hypothetical protein